MSGHDLKNRKKSSKTNTRSNSAKNNTRKSNYKYKGFAEDIKNAVAKFAWKEKWESTLIFCKNNVRYISASVLFLLLVLVLAVSSKTPEIEPVAEIEEIETETVVEETEDYVKDAYPEINTLISDYYKAYAKGKIDKITTLASPVSDTEKSYISVFSEYVKSYKNISCYTKKGLDENSYIVSVYLEMKFKGVETTAPGLDFFYVRTKEDGSLYIDNLYSQFNMSNQEQPLDSEVAALIEAFELQTDVIALQTEVQQKYEDAVASDENLKLMVEETIPNAITVWASDQVAAAKAAEEAKKAEEEAAAKAAEEAAKKAEEEAKKAAELANAVTVFATAKVNVRSEASETSQVIGQLEEGSQTTRLEDKDGWSRIDYSNGTQGYVKSEYLVTENSDQTEAPAEANDAAAEENVDSNGFAEGTKITVSQSLNMRESMTTDSEKVCTVYAGESVTVVFSYAEGWTKVSYGDKTGFIKTDLLK